jgi:hypothetical protein
VFAIDRSAAKLKDAGAQRLVRGKVKLAFGVIAQVARRGFTGLHAIRANDAAGQLFFDEKMLAEEIELVCVEASLVRAFEAFAHLDVEDAKAQTAGGIAIVSGFCEPETIPANLGMD